MTNEEQKTIADRTDNNITTIEEEKHNIVDVPEDGEIADIEDSDLEDTDTELDHTEVQEQASSDLAPTYTITNEDVIGNSDAVDHSVFEHPLFDNDTPLTVSSTPESIDDSYEDVAFEDVRFQNSTPITNSTIVDEALAETGEAFYVDHSVFEDERFEDSSLTISSTEENSVEAYAAVDHSVFEDPRFENDPIFETEEVIVEVESDELEEVTAEIINSEGESADPLFDEIDTHFDEPTTHFDEVGDELDFEEGFEPE